MKKNLKIITAEGENCLTSRESFKYQEVIELLDDHSTFRNREVVEISDGSQGFQTMHRIRSMVGLSSTPSASDEKITDLGYLGRN